MPALVSCGGGSTLLRFPRATALPHPTSHSSSTWKFGNFAGVGRRTAGNETLLSPSPNSLCLSLPGWRTLVGGSSAAVRSISYQLLCSRCSRRRTKGTDGSNESRLQPAEIESCRSFLVSSRMQKASTTAQSQFQAAAAARCGPLGIIL